MKSFKEIADELQKQAETHDGIRDINVRIISHELVMELSAILHKKGQHEAGICLFDAFKKLRDEKSN